MMKTSVFYVQLRILAVLGLLLATTSLYAQNWREGIIYQKGGSELSGFIKTISLTSWELEQVEFRLTEDAAVQTFKASEIEGYQILGRRLWSVQITGGQSHFLERLTTGQLSLYSGPQGFCVLDERKGEASYLEKEKKQVGSKTLLLAKYKGTLRSLMQAQSCEGLEEKIEKSRLAPSSITEVLQDYHTCKGLPFEVLAKQKLKLRLAYGVGGGFVSLHHKFIYNNLGEFDEYQGNGYQVSATIMGTFNGKLYFLTGLNFTQASISRDLSRTLSTGERFDYGEVLA